MKAPTRNLTVKCLFREGGGEARAPRVTDKVQRASVTCIVITSGEVQRCTTGASLGNLQGKSRKPRPLCASLERI